MLIQNIVNFGTLLFLFEETRREKSIILMKQHLGNNGLRNPRNHRDNRLRG